MRKVFLYFCLLLFTSQLITAQDSLENKVIYKIIYKGLRKQKKREITAVMMTREGMPLDISLLERDYQELMALNSFEDIIITSEKAIDERTGSEIPGMINISIEFIEKPTIRKIIFRGNNAIPFGFLRSEIISKLGDFVRKADIIGDISKLEEKYHEKGYSYVKVDYEIFENEELKNRNQVDLVYTIDEGTPTHIREIKFIGNNKFSEFTLKNRMKTKERKFLGLQKGTYTESQFYEDIEELKKFYRDQGFFKVNILKPEISRYEIEEDEEKKEVIDIKIEIEEGIQYFYGGLVLEGNKVFETEDLVFPLKLKKGHLFNFSKFQEDIFTIQKKYNDFGYVETTYEDEQIIDDESRTITVKLKIRESKRSYIEAVYFKGNTKTKDYVLHRAVATKVGDIFDYSKLVSSYIGLQNIGFFTKIEWDIQRGSVPGLVKIIYILEEGSSAEIRAGLQISTSKWPPDFTLFGELTEKNFLGRQLIARGKVEASIYKQGFEFSLNDYWFMNQPWSLGASVKFYHNWNQKVYREIAHEASVLNMTENDLRKQYHQEAGSKDETNKNYINQGDGQWANMGLHDINFEISANTGYRFFKYFSVSGAYTLTPTYTFLPMTRNSDDEKTAYTNKIKEMDSSLDSLKRVMLNGNGWSIRSKLSTTFAISTTKRQINPVEGLRFSLTTAYTWGHYDSVSLSSKFTYYLKLLEMNFDKWSFKNVLVFNMGASFIFPGFRNLGGENDTLYGSHTGGYGPIMYLTDWQQVDGIFVGRGWGTSIGASGAGRLTGVLGYARLDASIEYRVPIHEQFVWLAGFIDMVNLITGPGGGNNENWRWWNQQNFMGWENWYGSVGVGVQLTIPQLPLSFYVVKRFKVNYYGGFEWVGDPNMANLDFVIGMVGAYF